LNSNPLWVIQRWVRVIIFNIIVLYTSSFTSRDILLLHHI